MPFLHRASQLCAEKGKVSIISGDAADVILNQEFSPIDAYRVNPVIKKILESEGEATDPPLLSPAREPPS